MTKSQIFTKRKFMKGGALELNHAFLFQMALKYVEAVTNYALTHQSNLSEMWINITPEMLTFLRTKGAHAYEEVAFEKIGRKENLIVPSQNCTLTFKDIISLDSSIVSFTINIGTSKHNVGVTYVNSDSMERIIVGHVFLTRDKDSGKYDFDEDLLKVFNLLTNMDKQFESLLNEKKKAPEPEGWWSHYEEYAKFMGAPELQELKLKVLYDGDPAKMGGNTKKRT